MTGTRRRTAQALAAGLVVAAGVLLYLRDPRSSTDLPCPFHAITGLWCPACGATRAFGDLVRGDLGSAVSTNVLAVVLLGVAALMWILWVGGVTFRAPPRWVVVSGVVTVLAFTVFRNLPAGTALAP